MALYPPAVKKLLKLDPAMDPRETMRVVILHVDANNATSLYDYFNGPSGGVESHFFVKKDGTVEQYRDTAYQADANMAANQFAISIETQGYAAGTWSAAQLAAIKALLLWCHTTHGIPLVKCPKWDGSGVGYHILFMQQWAGGPRSCPGPDRIKQFDNVLVPWMAAGGNEEVVTPDDINKIALAVWGYTNPAVTTRDAYNHLTGNTAAVAALAKKVDALPASVAAAVVAKLPSGTVDVPALTQAIVAELAKTPMILGKA